MKISKKEQKRYDDIHARIIDSEYGEMQNMIDSGTCWKLEGSCGRSAMVHLESGACILPSMVHHDYYGNKIPAWYMLVDGTKGTISHAEGFYNNIRGYESDEE